MALTIKLFGPMVVQVDDQPFPRLHNRRALWLLALLVLRHGRPVEREWLAGTLWPDAEQDHAIANLRPVLSALKQALGAESERLQSPSRHTLFLDLAEAEVDVQAFDARIGKKTLPDLAEAVEIYTGPLLEGCGEEWVPQERRVREEGCLQALQILAKTELASGDFQTAAQYCSRAIDIDPRREEVRRLLMTALDSGGDSNAAQQAYRDFAQFLRRDLQTVPEKETTALYARLRSEAKRRAVQPYDLPKIGADSAAAVPVVNGHLPHSLTEIVGREDESLDVTEKLRHARLVTLTGPGGIGKTRLAVEVASQAVGEFADGAWLVSLEALSEGAQVVRQIAVDLGLKEEPGQPVLDSVVKHLRQKKALLVLDNCEHLISDCADIAAFLLRECATLRILATSRESLAIPGETAWAVPALTTPELHHLPSSRATLLRVLMSYESVQLFVERAQAVQKSFTLDAESGLQVAQICRQLDGIPLAIELAAARVNVLTPAQIADRLNDHLNLLAGNSRIVPPRHRTLRGALDWSYDLLTDAERTLLQRLSVFSGGGSLEAAEAVCAGDGLPSAQVLDLLSSLADKSLVIFEPLAWRDKNAALARAGVSSRYRLLETVRQYAAERLLASGDTDRLRARQRDYYLSFSEEAIRDMRGPNQEMWIWRLEGEQDNLRTALAWDGLTPEDAEAGLRLVIALSSFWSMRSHFSEGAKHVSRALARAGVEKVSAVRAQALNCAGTFALRLGDQARARALNDEALAIFRAVGNQEGIALTLNRLGNLLEPASGRALYEESLAIYRELNDAAGIATTTGNIAKALRAQGDYAASQALVEESLERFRELEDRWNIGRSLCNLGSIVLIRGDAVLAANLFEEGLSVRREIGDKHGTAWALGAMGDAANSLGKHAEAKVFLEEALSIRQSIGDVSGVAWALCHLGETAHMLGDPTSARAHLDESLNLFRNQKERMGTGWALYQLGLWAHTAGASTDARTWLAESLDLFTELKVVECLVVCLAAIGAVLAATEPEKAACLWGATKSLQQRTGLLNLPGVRRDYEREMSVVRSALGDEGFDLAWKRGYALTDEQAAALALQEIPEADPATAI